ncbi:MAG: hypothetical protein FD145_1539, partial [Candidatus Saganbacteria bacterium]
MEVNPNETAILSSKPKIRHPDKVSVARVRLNYIRMQIITYLSEISRFRSNSWVLARKAAELLSGSLSTLTALEKNLAVLKTQVQAVGDSLKDVHKFPNNQKTLEQNLAILEQNLVRIKQAYSTYHEKQLKGAEAGIFVVPALSPLIALGAVKIVTGAIISPWIFPSLSLVAYAFYKYYMVKEEDRNMTIYITKEKDVALAKLLLRYGYQPTDDSELAIEPLLPIVHRYTLITINSATKALDGFLNDYTTLNPEHLDKISKETKKLIDLYFSPFKGSFSPFVKHLLKDFIKRAKNSLTELLNNPEKFTNFAKKLTVEQYAIFVKIIKELFRILLYGGEKNFLDSLGALGHSPNRRIINITFNRMPSPRVAIPRAIQNQKGKSKERIFVP